MAVGPSRRFKPYDDDSTQPEQETDNQQAEDV